METLSTVDMEEMDTEESAHPDPHVALRKQLEILVKDSQVLYFHYTYTVCGNGCTVVGCIDFSYDHDNLIYISFIVLYKTRKRIGQCANLWNGESLCAGEGGRYCVCPLLN